MEFQVNRRFIFAYILTMGLNGICMAWTTGVNHQTASIFEAKLNWNENQSK